ncbi:hypothetical protein [Streptosporangium saharense]|uniref:hypothetical protein n=1 Tax=Streptosporangium saharense TaxID=1706840 RepID=UPI0033191545
MSPGERLVALEVADLANDQTRRAFGTATLKTLVRRTGYKDIEQVGKVLAKLAQRGLELRVPVLGKDGRPVVSEKTRRVLYACNGNELNFLVPDQSCPALMKPTRSRDLDGSQSSHADFDRESLLDHPAGSPRDHEGLDDEARALRSEGRVITPGRSRDQKLKPARSRDPSPHSPQDSSSLLNPTGRVDGAAIKEERDEDLDEEHPSAETSPVPGVPPDLAQRVMTETTATAEELARIVEAARRAGIQSPVGWLSSRTGIGDVHTRLTELRAAPVVGVAGPPRLDDYQAEVRAACNHGTPGGSARCALCRRRRTKPAPAVEPRVAAGPSRPFGGQADADASISAVRAVLEGLRARDRGVGESVLAEAG